MTGEPEWTRPGAKVALVSCKQPLRWDHFCYTAMTTTLIWVAQRGNPFSHASYNYYISGLLKKYLSRRLTTVDLRKIVVDYFLSLPENSDYSLRESFATLMKHSIRAQQKYYDERPLTQKKERALDLLTSVASRSLDCKWWRPGRVSRLLTGPGRFCGLGRNSTKNVPEVFVLAINTFVFMRVWIYMSNHEWFDI